MIDWKHHPTTALNILCIKEKEICPAYISKINSNWEKKYSIYDSKRRKRRLILSCGIETIYIIKRNNIKTLWLYIFYCLNCLYSFRSETNLKSPENVSKNKDFCGIVMLSEKDHMLGFNQYMKSDKMTCIVYAYIISILTANNVKT